MNWLNDTLSSEVAARLGWTLIHSLWQGALVAACLVGLLALIPKRRAHCRYLLCCLALVALLGGLAATFWLVPRSPAINPLPGGAAPAVSADVAEQRAMPVNPVVPMVVVETVDPPAQALAPSGSAEPTSLSWRDRLSSFFHAWIVWIVPVWLIGVIGRSIWHLGGWLALQRLRSLGTKPVSPDVKATLSALVRKLGLKRPVNILQSVVVKTPMAMGLVKPLILLPVSALAGLTPAQLEVILAHELAHIRRYDYLVNMFQTVAETLLFHHPAVWWISRSIRQEREYCCDDVVLSLTADRMNYAQALASLAEIGRCSSRLSVAAGGGSLVDRIQRIFGLSGEGRLTTTTWLPGFFFMILLGAAAVSMVNANARTDAVNEAESPRRFRGRVSDARTGQSVAHFRVLPGIDWDTFKGRQVFGWLEDEERAFAMGRFDYTFEKKYPVYRIGIRASGYLPAYSASFPHERGNQRLTLELEPLPQPRGVVLRPDGTPAAGAVVTLVLPGSRVDFVNGAFSSPMDWRRHNEPMGGEVSKTTADARGAFAFPDRTDPYIIAVEHEAGYGTISAKDLVRSPTCVLKPWARLEARLFVLATPAVNRSFGIISRPRVYDVMLRSEKVYTADMVLGDDHDLETDGRGRVVVERLVPGAYRVLLEPNRTIHSADSPLVLESGKTLVVDLGKARRSVVGRLKADPETALVINSRNVIVSVAPWPWFQYSLWRPQDRDLLAQVSADHKAFLESEEGKAYQCVLYGIEADGTFRIEDMPPGDYILNAKVYNVPVRSDSTPPETVIGSFTTRYGDSTPGFRLDVEPVVYENDRVHPTSNAEPLDLGDLVVQPAQESFALTARILESKQDGSARLRIDTSLPVPGATPTEVFFPVEFAAQNRYGGHAIVFTVVPTVGENVAVKLLSSPSLPIFREAETQIDSLEMGRQASVPLFTEGSDTSRFQLQLSVSRTPVRETAAEAARWSEAEAGVQLRLQADTITVPQGTVPQMLVDIRNLGSTDRSIALEHESWELEINGRWRKTNVFRSGVRRYLPLKSEQVQRSVKAWLSENLQGELKKLAGGTHRLRIARILNSVLEGKSKDRIRLVSHPFEIEITESRDLPPDIERSTDAAEKRSGTSSEIVLRRDKIIVEHAKERNANPQEVYPEEPAERSTGRPAGERAGKRKAAKRKRISWGQATDGVQCRLHAEKLSWQQGRIPTLFTDIRNRGNGKWEITLSRGDWELEIDGQRCKPSTREPRDARVLLSPGGQREDLKLVVLTNGNLGLKLHDLPPGEHTLRLICMFNSTSTDSAKKPLRVVSSPLQVDILPVNVDIPWGKPVEDVQCRLRVDQRTRQQGTELKLFVDLRNRGKRDMTIAIESESWEVEIDGVWHKPRSFSSGRRRYLPLAPGQRQVNVEVWTDANDRLQQLTLGRHSLRVARILPSAMESPVNDRIRIVSNPVEIEIVSAANNGQIGVPILEKGSAQPQQSLPAISISPSMEAVGELKNLRIIAQAVNAYGSEKIVKASMWEIRTADNSKRIAQIPYDWPWPKSPETTPLDPDGEPPWPGWGERSGVLNLSASQLRQTGRLKDGVYLLAWIINDTRQSNVCHFRINQRHEPANEPLLKLSVLPLAPNTTRNGKLVQPRRLLSLCYTRRTNRDPVINNSEVAFATLNVNGKDHRPKMMTWTGPVGPPKIGGHMIYLLEIASYEPVIESDRAHLIFAKIRDHQSDDISLTPVAARRHAWDIASARVRAPEAARIAIQGLVIGSNGKGAANYVVCVEHEQWKNNLGDLPVETTNKDGTFVFYNLPAGMYDVFTNPIGSGQPMLRITGVLLTEKKAIEVELNLEHKFTFSGKVIDAADQPVSGRDVMGVWKSPDGKAEFNDFATTDAAGRYTLGSPFPVAAYMGLSGTGPQPKPHRNVRQGRRDVDFQTAR